MNHPLDRVMQIIAYGGYDAREAYGIVQTLMQIKKEHTRFKEALRDVSSETLIYNGVPEFDRIGDIARTALEGK